MTERASPPDAVVRGRDAATRHDWEQTLEALTAAEAQAPLDPDDLELAATAAYLVGRVDDAVDALSRSYTARIDAGDRTGAAGAGFWAIFMLMNRGAVARASGWVNRCASLLEQLPPEDIHHAYMRCLGAFRAVAMEHDYETGHAVASDVVDRARSASDRDLLALSLNIDGRALVRSGDIGIGMGRLDEAMLELVSSGLSPIVAGTVYCSMIEACEEVAEVRRAQEWTEALTRWCDRQEGMLTFNGQCLTHRATILRRHGRWSEAIAEAEMAQRRFVGAADEQATGRAIYERAEVHRMRGEDSEAEQAYRDAASWGHDPLPGLALLRLHQGDVEAAVSAMRRGMSEANDPPHRLRLLPAFVDVLLADGAVDDATAGAAELRQLADRYGTAALDARASFAEGAVALATEDPHTALPALRSAVETWRRLPDPYEEARTRVLLGDARAALGDQDAATLAWDEAARALRELGAIDLVGDRGEAGEDIADSPLSPRELEVLRLVATGMTNQQVADELFLAVKTIDRHVGNILMKLDVPSRTAATAYAYEHQLL